MKIFKNLLMIAFCISVLGACTEFIEPSLNNRHMELLAPGDQLETNIYLQTFWWETQEDALQYRLQVATPGFANPARLLLDTVIRGDKFLYTLDPGKYEWRVRAENGSSATPYALRSLTVFPSSLGGQTVQVRAPLNTFLSASEEIRYEWLNIFGAGKYRLQVDDKAFADTTKLLLDVEVEKLSYVQSLPAEGKYQFRIRAENASQNSKWSIPASFTYDKTPPAQVVLSLPANKSVVVKPLRLSWETLTDAAQYELVVYKSDSVSVLTPAFPMALKEAGYTLNTGAPGDKLFWKVRAIDQTGNKGKYSNLSEFTLK